MAQKHVALLLCALLIVALVETWSRPALGVEAIPRPPRPDYPHHAPKLVEQALAADLDGQPDQRAALLKRAIDADADCAPARWQSGQVMFDGKWRTPAEVARHVETDRRWKEYETLRAEAGQIPADHFVLAQWCMRNELSAEERYHWANVLLANPEHAQARQRLGMQTYQGGLFSKEQVAADKARRAQEERDAKRFQPKFISLCRSATGDLKVNRDKALAQIRAIDDPAAIPALREAVRRTVKTTAGERHRSELILAMTAALANMPQHPATLHLVELSVYSTLPEVRQAAAEALRTRPATDYVPLLMTALQAPIEAEVDVMAAPDGTVRMVQTFYQQEPLREVSHLRSTNFEVEGAFGRDQVLTNPAAVLNGHLQAAAARAGAFRSEMEETNASAAARNERIQATLKIALGMEASREDVAAWWRAWQDLNELEYDVAPTAKLSHIDETSTYVYEQAPEYTTISGDMRASERASEPRASRLLGRTASAMTFTPATEGLSEWQRIFPPRSSSCFAPGTLVWRQSGPAPIEQIHVGDMVLAQHPTTGELAYRPVLEKTVGNMTPVLSVKLPDDEIVTTLGHRFWVEGDGWRMAKELQAVRSLHSLNGGQAIEAVEPAGEMECHNLEVDEFHTFVIGKSQILVHDKTCPQPTLAVTPGLADPKLKQDKIRAAQELLSAAAD